MNQIPEEHAETPTGSPVGEIITLQRPNGQRDKIACMPRKKLKSDLGWSTTDRITVRGKDLPNEILGHLNLGDMAFLEIMGRTPNPKESTLFNALAVTLVEHGVTPSALAARLTYLGAPEAMQAAVAAG